MRVFSIGLLLASLICSVSGCKIIGQGSPQPMTPSLALLPEGRGIKRLPSLENDPRTDQIFWTVPFYQGHVGGHTVLGKVGELPQRLDDLYQGAEANWSQDGKRVALTIMTGTKVPEAPNTSIAGNGLYAVYINDPGKTTYHPLVSGLDCGNALLSPDGSKLLISNMLNLNSFQYTIYDLSDHSQKGIATLTSTLKPVWSPDGTKISFLSQGHSLILYDLQTDKQTIVDTVSDALLGWTPDSKTVYTGVTQNSRTLALTAFTPDGTIEATASIDLPTDPSGTPHTPMLSPDGTKVAFVLQELTSQGVYLADVHGGPARQVVPPSFLLGWLAPSTILCEIYKNGNLQVDYTVDLTQR